MKSSRKQQREYRKEQISEELEPVHNEVQEKIDELGINPREVTYWINHNEEINELAAYGGFQERYPHWRWGMKYDRQSKKDEYAGGKIFEMVINNDPCHAYLQMSNEMIHQKAVIAHVEAHSDFFANNEWFQDSPEAADMLSRNANRIEQYMKDPEIDRSEVEKWIDTLLCIQDNIDQHSDYIFKQNISGDDNSEDIERSIENLGLDELVEERVFGEEFFDAEDEENDYTNFVHDIIAYLIQEGKQYDDENQRATEYDDWQIDIMEMMREEFYYFAPQKMTKIMNEGWASYIESLVMMDEGLADFGEIIEYADQHSKVIRGGNFNPYRLGKSLWEHLENTVNRREVIDKLLRIDGINTGNFHRKVDFQKVHDILDERGSDDIIIRNYSLTRPQNQGFIQDVKMDELNQMDRYLLDTDKYESMEEALDDVNYYKGWKRMKEVRETHNDAMFIDEFLTQKFVDDNNYFTWEYHISEEDSQIASRDVDDVKKKLLLELTNFGKPTIVVADGNHNNKGELLMIHQYNGVVLNDDKVKNLMERLFNFWGRPINLATVGKYVPETEMDYSYSENVEPNPEEKEFMVRFDGDDFESTEISDEDLLEVLHADEVDYSTKPEDWL